MMPKKTIHLTGKDDVIHYKATFEPMSHIVEKPHWTGHQFANTLPGDYEFLFHGPLLHSIVSIQKDKSNTEAIGQLKTATGMNWKKTDWFFDPFACDGALQMGCQLAFMTKKEKSLPSKIKRAIFYQKPVGSDVFASLVFQKISPLHYVFDAHLFDRGYAPVCSLEGIESYFRLLKKSNGA